MEQTDSLSRAEELIERGELAEAQKVLDGINERDAEWHFVQSRLFLKKNWHNEARKQLEIALLLEPENGKLKDALEQLKTVEAKTGEDENTRKEKKKIFNRDDCAECCCAASCEICCAGLCEAICDGCG